MIETAPMLPGWISPPGAIIARILSSMQVELDEFATGLGVSTRHARDLIDGSIAIAEAVATRLSSVVGATPSFWLRAEKLLADVNFRTSEAYHSQPTATAAWLRWAEGKAEEKPCAPWNREAFSESLGRIRTLTRNHHPDRFVPKLREMCAATGVAIVISPAPKGCRASGATRMIRRSRAIIVLSFRYYSDDQFWFTFFHEAGHLVRHADQDFFLESEDGEVDDREDEANAFALDTLIPFDVREKMRKLPPRHNAYISFAKEVGIAPGIVVGQMQRLELLPYGWLNSLKRRFDWKALYAQGVIP